MGGKAICSHVVFMVSTSIPRAPALVRGFISAVGNPSTNRVSAPGRRQKDVEAPPMIASKVPLVRSMLIATSIPTRYGIMRTAVSNPPFAP